MEKPLLRDPDDLENFKTTKEDPTSSLYGLLTFKFIDPLLTTGAVRQLQFDDLLELPSQLEPFVCYSQLSSCWEAQQNNNAPSLFKSICNAYGWQYIRLGLLKLLNDSIGFFGPLLLNKLIRFLQQGSRGSNGFILAMGLGCVSVSKSFLDTQYTYHLSKLKLKLRSGIMVMIYHKCLSITIAERNKISEGEIQTYMSIDADRVVNLCNSFHDMWSLPLQIGIALCMLYTQVRFAFVAGVAIIILLIPVNKWISNLIATATKEMMKQKDGRIGRTAELLTHIRTLKMYGWELLFTSWLMKMRSSEVKHLSTRKYLDAWCVFFWATTPTLFSLCTFGLFVLTGDQLDAATVFTCLALFNILISPLNSFPWVINGLIDAVISTKRLTMFMAYAGNVLNMENDHEISPSFTSRQLVSECDETAVLIQDACCSWSIDDEKGKIWAVDHVTLSLPKGSLVAITGEVGCGKSSLLNAILGETLITHGTICSHGSKAYVPQVPWILSGTIRSNILLGKAYDPLRYSNVLRGCALDVDISRLVAGDMTFVVEKGSNLSGGQKSRIALARAIYHGCDIFLLDDVLSAVDVHVASWILDNAILGPLMNQQTRVLCTHNSQAVSSADMIVIMDKGHVKWVGNSREYIMSSYSIHPSLEVSACSLDIDSSRAAVGGQSHSLERDFIHMLECEKEIVEEEQRMKGRVEISIYKKYAGFCGWFITVIICVSAVAMQAARNGNDLWLSYWVDTVDSEEMDSTLLYLVILSTFCLLNSLLTLIRAFSFAYGGLRAAVRMHDTLIVKLVGAPVSFFDETPGGRILNRFSSDLYTIDDSLPFILNILLANSVALLGIVAVLLYVQVIFLVALLPLWFLYSKLQFYYRSTSRELRRLDSVSRSPIYASFTETLDGSSTIRALKSEDYFSVKFNEQVALYSKTSYSEIAASLWLSLRLQLIGAFVISFVAVMAVVGSHGNLPIRLGTPGTVGLALSYAAPVVSLLGSFLTNFVETEKEMVSVERVMQYMNAPQEELHEKLCIESGWPWEGHIEFRNVTLRYKPSLPAALYDLTFSIESGNQVGIIGRTGAGKSSILNALFRLAPICGGDILVDGTNINDVSLRDLRMHFAVVPQTPFLFEGSLRENVDPFHMNDDIRIWSILKKCQIKNKVASVGGLDISLKEPGKLFSVGQQQLICLARAFLKSSKILCLDECTANVDSETATIIQNAISSLCRGVTVIMIAHRMSTISKMDDVIILSGGRLVERGNPQVLLQDEYSIFSSFIKASTM